MATITQLLFGNDYIEKRGAVTYGFNRQDLSAFFGGNFNDNQLDAIQRFAAGKTNMSDAGYIKVWQNEKFSSPSPIYGQMNSWDNIVAALNHLSQHPKGSQAAGAFMSKGKGGDPTVSVPDDFGPGKAKAAADTLKSQSDAQQRRGRVDTYTMTPSVSLLGSPFLSKPSLGGRSLLG